jgi:phospholipid/cholesterol/gamma-HCH transport system permease protein
VLTALICAGKVGSGIGAELGSMKVSEQIDAMTVSGANAFNYLVVTRVLACTIMVPILVFYSDAIAMIGSFVGVNFGDDISLRLFATQAINALDFLDIIPATIKTFFFGFAIGIVGCYEGYNASKGTTGVGDAANRSVVTASIFIFVIDLLTVQITQFFL